MHKFYALSTETWPAKRLVSRRVSKTINLFKKQWSGKSNWVGCQNHLFCNEIPIFFFERILFQKSFFMDYVNYEYLLNYTIFSSLQHYSDHFMRQYKGKWSIIIKMGSHVTRFKRDLIIWYQIEFTAIRALMTLPWVTMTIITNSAHDMRNAIVS